MVLSRSYPGPRFTLVSEDVTVSCCLRNTTLKTVNTPYHACADRALLSVQSPAFGTKGYKKTLAEVVELP